MSEKELFDLLKTITIGDNPIDVAYDHFEEYPSHKVVPPFILFRNTETQTFKADDNVHYQIDNYIVDLITDVKRDRVLEGQIEQLFKDNHLPYDKEADYIDDERIYQVRFFI